MNFLLLFIDIEIMKNLTSNVFSLAYSSVQHPIAGEITSNTERNGHGYVTLTRSTISPPSSQNRAGYPLQPVPLTGQHWHLDPSGQQEPIDPSEALFSIYLARSDEDDGKIVKRWKAECNTILIFVGHSYQT
jgi:hypothetical protein